MPAPKDPIRRKEWLAKVRVANKGREFSKEWRENMGKAAKGRVGWNKGMKTPDETKRKMSKALKGRILSESHKRKIGLANRNREYSPMSKEGKKHISESLKGRILSDEWKSKMSQSRLNRKKILGYLNSPETRKKMSEAHMGHIPWNKGLKKCWSKETLKKILTRRIPSSLEEKFQKIINKHNLPYKFVGDGSFIIGNYNPDFINTNSEKIAIEVYATYYKEKRFNIEEWKKERTLFFKEFGWKILYFDETEVNEDYVLNTINRR